MVARPEGGSIELVGVYDAPEDVAGVALMAVYNSIGAARGKPAELFYAERVYAYNTRAEVPAIASDDPRIIRLGQLGAAHARAITMPEAAAADSVEVALSQLAHA